MTYMPFIDGLRALAVIVILLFHLDVSFVHGGFIGVDIFFVISGFLITRIIHEEMNAGRFSFANFYARRVRRIFPALFFMLICTSGIAVLVLGMDEFSGFFKSLRYASAQISNFYFNKEIDYFAPEEAWAPLLHTWSLGVEEQFYLLWPLLLLFIHKYKSPKKQRIILGALFLFSLAISEYLVRTDALSAFYMLHSRAWQLALGGLVALKAFPSIKSVSGNSCVALLGLAMMLVAAVSYTPENFPGLKAMMPTVGAALLFYSYTAQPTFVHGALSFQPLRAIGLISYSLYLWHWPFVAFYKQYTSSAELDFRTQTIIALLSLAAAVISYFFIEKPFRTIKSPPYRLLLSGLGVIVFFVITSNLIKDARDASWRLTYNPDPLEREPHDLDRVCSVTGGKDKDECIIGPNKDGYEVILAGDSNASHFTPMLLAWAKAEALTVRLFMRSACATWLYRDKTPMRYGEPDTDCIELVKDFHEILKNNKSIRYVFLGKNLPGDSPMVRASLDEINSHDVSIYFLGAIPRFKENPHKCKMRDHVLISKWIRRESGSCMELDPGYYNEALKTVGGLRELLKQKGIPYFDPIPYMDTAYDNNQKFMLLDESHLNRYGSLHLATPFIDFMRDNPPETRK